MSTYKTPYLSLNTWAPTDNVDREEFNKNFDAIDGSILDVFTKIGSVTRRVVNSVADLKTTNFKDGEYAKTLGFYVAGGGGEAEYVIKNDTQTSANGMSVIQLNNGLKAFLQYYRRIDVLQLGAKPDRSADASPAIQHALNLMANKGGRVIIPDGQYNIYSAHNIGSYTYLIMGKNAVFYRIGQHSFFNNGKEGDNYVGYGGPHHIVVKGGIFEGNILEQPLLGNTGFGGMNFAHTHDLIIDGVVIKDIAFSHPIEINSANKVIIENCEFLGYVDPTSDGSRSYAEAIQLDSASLGGFPSWGAWDGTTTKNVTIRNCKFGASGTPGTKPIFTGIGGHSSIHDIYIQDVLIEDCIFEGQTYAGVRAFKWKNVTIKNNRFVDCASPILCETPTFNSGDTKDLAGTQMIIAQPMNGIKIVDNFIANVTSGDAIRVAGKGSYSAYSPAYATDIIIRGNTVLGTPALNNAISVEYGKNVRAYDNYAENTRRVVYANGCVNTRVYENSGTNLQLNVAYLVGCSALKVYENMTDSCGEHGILVDKCTRFKLYSNTIEGAAQKSDSTYSGIHITNESTNGHAYENTVRKGSAVVGVSYGLRVTSVCSDIKTFNNDLEGSVLSYTNETVTRGDSFYMYSTGTNLRFKITVADNGTISAVQA